MLLNPDQLNADCTCISLDRSALCRALEAEVGDPEFCRQLIDSHPTLISSLPVFLRGKHVARMAAIIQVIEAVAKLEEYQTAALRSAPASSHFQPGAVGVFMGYDFHLGPDGPKLIEINTNAGGALVNAYVARSQKACCAPVEAAFPRLSGSKDYEASFLRSFHSEWRRQQGEKTLKSIAIVDDDPDHQYLYPEFVLFERMFKRHGLEAVIAPPQQLEHRGGRLMYGDLAINLVYNRLTDFSLEAPGHGSVLTAYLSGDAVVTPNPWAHAMFADKGNLVRLSSAATLKDWGVPEEKIRLLTDGIPRTTFVTKDQAEGLWAARSRLFFKPAAGYGGKAAYRGEKLTRRVWETILKGGYVAQDLVPPSARTVAVDGEKQTLKVDIRNYTYDGEIQLIAARLYQGQTTNFRTPGGGFAPVFFDSSR